MQEEIVTMYQIECVESQRFLLELLTGVESKDAFAKLWTHINQTSKGNG